MTFEKRAAEYDRLNAAVQEAKRELTEATNARTAFLYSIAGVSVGDVVSDGKRELKVVRVSAAHCLPHRRDWRFSKASIAGVTRRADGTWGVREFHPWDWIVVRTAAQEGADQDQAEYLDEQERASGSVS